MNITTELRLRIGELRSREIIIIGEEEPPLSEEEIASIERGEIEEI